MTDIPTPNRPKDHVCLLTYQQCALIRGLLIAFDQGRPADKYRGTLRHCIEDLEERMCPDLRADLYIGIPLREPKP